MGEVFSPEYDGEAGSGNTTLDIHALRMELNEGQKEEAKKGETSSDEFGDNLSGTTLEKWDELLKQKEVEVLELEEAV